MSDRISAFLHLIFQIYHEQSSTLRHDIINVSRITERILERSRSETVNGIDCRLQSICKLLRCHLAIDYFLNVRSKFTIQHLIHDVPSLMLDTYTTLDNIAERCRELHSEQNFGNRTMRMHRSNIQQCNISVHTRLRIYITAFSNFLSTIHGFSVLKSIPREIRQKASSLTMSLLHHFRASFRKEIIRCLVKIIYRLCKIPIVELILRLTLIPKYNPGCECIRGVIDCHTC